ncbi:hypothetical protein GCM10010222_30190 [Streptomyces tanashiensis]|nr:hypothetical protein GCM10010222_30190 [Streptomyces tanashiensis]
MPKAAQSSPHMLSQNRRRRALRAFAGSFPVRMTVASPLGAPEVTSSMDPGRGKRNGCREARAAAQCTTL